MNLSLANERLPAAIVDLDALDRNLDRHVALVGPRGTPLRIASKSVRVVALLQRLLARGGSALRGLMCFSVEEAVFLADRRFDDLLVAYPTLRSLDAIAGLAKRGVVARVVVDSIAGVNALGAAGARAGIALDAVICLDMSLSLLGGRVFVGVRRSPLRTPADVLALARHARDRAKVGIAGVMGYEAIVAGVGDAKRDRRLENAATRLVKERSIGDVARRRSAIVRALEDDGFELRLVNGGGTGSLESTTPATGVTEVTAGSGFYKPHLFDAYRSAFVRSLEPAAFFALEATRRPARGFVTCAGGGYIASGATGNDRAPLPWHPSGLRLLPLEGAGEVQTPLAGEAADAIALGEPVIFRHAKAGELMERFASVLLVSGGTIVDRVPTYRGEGGCFL